MKTKTYWLPFFILSALSAQSQRTTMELTFTAIDSAAWTQLDSIKVMNRTQGGDTVLYWPDTVLTLYFVGLPEPAKQTSGFQVFQNRPNPVLDRTLISMFIPEKGRVMLTITDVLGRQIISQEGTLDKGLHTYQFTPGDAQLYYFNVYWKDLQAGIKILHPIHSSGKMPSLSYIGSENHDPGLKTASAIQEFTFTPGDNLLFIGYVDSLQSGLLDDPEGDQSYIFQFALNIPCPGYPMITHGGQAYNTIQIGSQCWLKENMNVGKRISGAYEMYNNQIIEKYCYDNLPDNCTVYGGLYQWDEMMQYNILEGGKGICPPDWHIPSDEEWKVLEGYADSQYGIGDPEWDIGQEFRGYDVGLNLRSTFGWTDEENGTDLYGYTGLPGGERIEYGVFDCVQSAGAWWTSTETSNYRAWFHYFWYDRPGSGRYDYGTDMKERGFSVRCLRNIEFLAPITLTYTAVYDTNYVQLDSIRIMNRTQEIEAVIHWPDTIFTLICDLPWKADDILLFIGYHDTLQSGLSDSPEEDHSYTFQFATNIPCPGTPTITYGNQVYNTIQIFSQCWLKENLNIGKMIYADQDQTDNDTIEKYCYGYKAQTCDQFGGLYQWDEMMQYTNQPGAQGICPPGWHTPTNEEWKVLEGAVDSQYRFGDPEWDENDFRGFDAGYNLKSSSDWSNNGNGSDLYGFSALPGGLHEIDGYHYYLYTYGFWWNSEGYYGIDLCGNRSLSSDSAGIHIYWDDGNHGFSVRCVKDY